MRTVWIPRSTHRLALGPAGKSFPHAQPPMGSSPRPRRSKQGLGLRRPDSDANTMQKNSKNKHEPCNAIEDWYSALGNVTRECGIGNTGFFYDAHRQIAWYVRNYLLVWSALKEILTFVQL